MSVSWAMISLTELIASVSDPEPDLDIDGAIGRLALLGDDARASAIVAAVLHIAEALDLIVVVEGVETDGQVKRVVELRDRSGSVDLYGQGFCSVARRTGAGASPASSNCRRRQLRSSGSVRA